MLCTKCGANVPANSNFCGHCGAKIAAPSAAQFADTGNIEVPARPKPETEAPARTKPEAAQSADTSNIEAPAEPKSQTAPFKKKEKAQAHTEKTPRRGDRSVIVFTVVAVLLALPVAWLLPDLGPGVSGGAAFLVTAAVALAATWIFEKIVYRSPRK